MNCPVCGCEMEKGFLQGGQSMCWVKKKHKFFLLPGSGEVSLGNNILGGLAIDAFICKACKKIVLDYSHSDFEEG